MSHEKPSADCDGVEITCYAKGPVVRAEACAEDKYAALDLAIDKLMERLRRSERPATGAPWAAHARVRRAGDRRLRAVHGPQPPGCAAGQRRRRQRRLSAIGRLPGRGPREGPPPAPMTLTDALSEMELVGHDFYLFHDIDTDRASVVYRRRGWSYGVIHLTSTLEALTSSRGLAASDGQEAAAVESAPAARASETVCNDARHWAVWTAGAAPICECALGAVTSATRAASPTPIRVADRRRPRPLPARHGDGASQADGTAPRSSARPANGLRR